MANPLIVASAISAGSNLLGQIFGGTPEGPDIEGIRRMINQEFDQQLASQLAQIARQTRAQLTAAGQSGSGTINQAIIDNQNRLRESLEVRRSQALRQLEQFKIGGDLQQANLAAGNTQQFFSGLGELGANVALSQMENPFQAQLARLNSSLFEANLQRRMQTDPNFFSPRDAGAGNTQIRDSFVPKIGQ